MGNSIVLMGKNTMMKRSIRLYCEKTGDDKWPALLDQLVGNVGLIFTKADLAEVGTWYLWQAPLILGEPFGCIPSAILTDIF